jgi:hypothetical protein
MDRAVLQALADKWDIVLMAPQAFFAALCTGAFGGWLLARVIYNNRLTHHQELIANYRDVLEEKIPARALRPFPIRRTKRMIFGLILIFVGLGAALSGALVILFGNPPSNQAANTNSPAVPPSVVKPATQNVLPSTPPPAPENKVFVDRTARELMALYEGRTMLQADRLIEPYKGKWIKANGTILQLIPSGPDFTAAVLRDGEKLINCIFGPNWHEQLMKLNNDDVLKVIGKIGPSQNGQQLYLSECEII